MVVYCALVLVCLAAITEYHRSSAINVNGNLFCHSFGVWKFKVRMPAWSNSGEGFVLGLHAVPSGYVFYVREGERRGGSLESLSIRALISCCHGDSTLTTSRKSDYLPTVGSLNESH